MGWLGVLYMRYLRTLLGVSWSARNEVLYVLSGDPFSFIWLKAVFCFVLHVDKHPGLLGLVAAWVCGLDSKRLWSGSSLRSIQKFAL